MILVGPHATYYDIDTTGDSTWTGNYEIKGTHRLWAPVRNEHNGANYAGVAVSAGEDDYGADTELRAAATATRPFKVIGFKFEPSEEKKFLTRFSADSGSTFFNMDLTEVKKNKATGASQGTDFIFNVGIRISCSSGCEVAGKTIQV